MNVVYFGLFLILFEMITMKAADDKIVKEFDWISICLLLLMSILGWISMISMTTAF